MTYKVPGVYVVGGTIPSMPYDDEVSRSIPSEFKTPENANDLRETNTSNNSVVLSWNPSLSLSVVEYQIFRNNSLIDSTNSTTYTAIGLQDSTEYVFTIKSVSSMGNISSGISIVIRTTSDNTLDGGTFTFSYPEFEDGGLFDINPIELIDGGVF